MKLERKDLDAATAAGVLADGQAERLWAFLHSAGAGQPRFDFTHLLYYLGGLIAIGAMSLFMTLGWERYGGWAVFWLALGYGGLCLKLADFFARRELTVPSGLMATLAIALVPLAVFGLQHGLGYWQGDAPYRDYHVWIDWRWIFVELATLIVGALLFLRYRFPFMTMPIAVTLWYMSMDLAPLLLGPDLDWVWRKWVSVWFGAIVLLLALYVELRTRAGKGDYAFWLYLAGLLAFWGGLSAMNAGSEWGRLAYCAINLALIMTGAVLSRRSFVVFGGLGVAIYLGDLSWRVFRDSLLFPLALSAIGIGIVFLGVWWQRHERALSARLQRWLPVPLREIVARRG